MTASESVWIVTLLFGLLGAAVGSHLNVVIARVPAGKSVVMPASACPSCDAPIQRRDNVPLLSWLVLGGRCRRCSVRIPVRYPLVEAITAASFAISAGWVLSEVVDGDLAVVAAAVVRLVAVLLFVSVGIALVFIDIDVLRLPDALVVPAIIGGIVLIAQAAGLEGDFPALGRALVGGGALMAFYGSIHVGSRGRGMGLGDVKLSALCGLYLAWFGWDVLLVGAFLPFLLGTIASAVVIRRGGSRKTAIPFGPFMLIGTVVALAFGHPIATAYLSVIGLG